MTRQTQFWVLGALVLGLGSRAGGQPASSAALAGQLTAALQARQTEAWAVRDPADPSRFIAALYLPGSQLLVVSTPYHQPEVLEYRIGQQDYRQAYIDLQTSAVGAGKFFVQDMGADGFDDSARGVDVVYQNGTQRTVLNGDWKTQHLSEADYERRRSDAETRYAHMLSTLVEALRQAPPGAPANASNGASTQPQ